MNSEPPEPPAPTNGLVNGSYINGKVIVTNGNTIQILRPQIYSLPNIPLQQAVISSSTIKLEVTGTTTNLSFYAKVNGTDREVIGVGGHSGSITRSGEVTHIEPSVRASGVETTVTLSLTINGEVIF